MEEATKRRLTVLATGVVLAAVATTLVQFPLVDQGVVAAEPYAVAVGIGVATPLLLAGAYPRTESVDGRSRAVLVVAEAVAGVLAGVGAVALLVTTDLPDVLAVGAGAASTYVGATAARALVLGRLTAAEKATP